VDQIQVLMDGMSAQWQREWAENQLTLGELIDTLQQMSTDRRINGLGELCSYRGYYQDLSFEPTDTEERAGALLERCRNAMGRTSTGYKGGDFVMGEHTPLWVAP
jgi:hypothetical protein